LPALKGSPAVTPGFFAIPVIGDDLQKSQQLCSVRIERVRGRRLAAPRKPFLIRRRKVDHSALQSSVNFKSPYAPAVRDLVLSNRTGLIILGGVTASAWLNASRI